MTDKERLKKFLTEQEYMVLAVTLDDGTPWATPIRIKLQWGAAFEWDSKLDAEHSKAIANRPSVAISIFTPKSPSTEVFGFYAKAEAKLMKEENGFGRYQALVEQAWINDASFVKREVELVVDA